MAKSSRVENARELFDVLESELLLLTQAIDRSIAIHPLLAQELLSVRFELIKKSETLRDLCFELSSDELAAYLDSQPVAKKLEKLLTQSETAVLDDLVKGLTTSEIARSRHNSEATIKTHLSSIYRKLGVRNRVEAVTWVVQEDH